MNCQGHLFLVYQFMYNHICNFSLKSQNTKYVVSRLCQVCGKTVLSYLWLKYKFHKKSCFFSFIFICICFILLNIRGGRKGLGDFKNWKLLPNFSVPFRFRFCTLKFYHAELRGWTKYYYEIQRCIIMTQKMNYRHFDVRNQFEETKIRNLITCFNNKVLYLIYTSHSYTMFCFYTTAYWARNNRFWK